MPGDRNRNCQFVLKRIAVGYKLLLTGDNIANRLLQGNTTLFRKIKFASNTSMKMKLPLLPIHKHSLHKYYHTKIQIKNTPIIAKSNKILKHSLTFVYKHQVKLK